MEVILNSEIAYLVLGYLNDQNLHNVSAKFCRHSPYLSEQNEILKKGLLPITVKNDTLVQIIREYCQINSKVTKTVEIFPQNVREVFAKQNLIGKISYLLKLAKKNISINNADTSIKSDTNNSYRKNKRRRSEILSENSTIETTQVKDLPGYCSAGIKKRRISGSYFFVQEAHSASSDDNSSDEVNDGDVIEPIIPENTTNTTVTMINNNNQSNIQTNTDTPLQSSTIYPLNSINEPPVIIDTPKPKSTIIFKTANTNNQINNNKILQTPGPSNEQQNCGNNSICTSSLIDPNFSISKLIIMNPNDATTNESIFNNTNNIGLNPFSGEQVFIDLGTGQTYPFIMTNDGMNCMLLNRNADIETNNVQQVLLTNTAQATASTSISTTIADIEESNNQQQETNEIFDKHITQSLDSKIIKENLTPDNNTIISQPIIRSLSTPRRKSSHVRILNFSPLIKMQNDKSNNQNESVIVQEQQENTQQIVSNQPIIESVQILPQLKKPFIPTFKVTTASQQQQQLLAPTAATVTQSLTVENDCSNSNSIDLTGSEHNNVTVIQKLNVDTPRRKRNLRSCKRVISQSNSEDGGAGNKKNKTNMKTKKKIVPKKKKKLPNKNKKENIIVVEDKEIDPMEEWRQMRLKTQSTNFDQHLREMAAKTPTGGHFRNNSKRRKRRKIGANTSRDDEDNTDINDDDTPNNSSTEQLKNQKPIVIKPESKTTLLNFKIKTPIKINSPNNKKNIKKNKNYKSPIKKNVVEIEKDQKITVQDENNLQICGEDLNTKKVEDLKNIDSTDIIPATKSTDQQPSTSSDLINSTMTKEREKRTANIAHLLETPFKSDSLQIPATPQFIEPQNIDTPAIKLPPHTVFSTLKHLDIRTPAFAITPGSSLTPADKETPKSGCLSNIQTDYSSGGSYYRPDESEDLDKQLDRNLNDEMRKRRLHKNSPAIKSSVTTNIPIKELEKPNENDTNKFTSEKNEQKAETTPEVIVSCPVVLEKVKSFSDEKPNFIPHYKFSDALPELTDETSTSSSSSSSSSSSPSSVSSKSSTSSSTSSSTDSSKKTKKSLFSIIDSSEDEEWEDLHSQKNKELNEENSQLITNDGEVRFPVRSWITPKKLDHDKLLTKIPQKLPTAINPIQIQKNSMMTIYDEKSKQKSELEQKRQRIKEQLAEDFKNTNKQYKKTPPLNKITPISKTKKNDLKIEKSTTIDKKIINEKSPENRNRQIEVLTALNLSARKKPIDDEQQKPQNILPTFDDNATSDIFYINNADDDDNSQHSLAESLKIRNAALALTSLSMQPKKRLTVPIEPLPMKQIKNARGRPKKIQINKKPDSKTGSIKKEIIKQKTEPVKTLKIKLRRETRLSHNLLQKSEKKIINKNIPSELTNKHNKTDAIKKTKLNEDKLKSNKLDQENNKPKIIEPQPSTSKCILPYLLQPPIQSSEIRSSVEETGLPVKLNSNPISSTSKSEKEIVHVSSATDDNQIKYLNQNKTNKENIVTSDCQNNNNDDPGTDDSTDDFEEEEEDPYESCKLIKSDNMNIKTIIYSGPDDFCPELMNNQYDFNNSSNNGNIISTILNYNGILHKLQCTNEISLFTMEPKLKINQKEQNNTIDTKKDNKRIKSIPKKRERNIKVLSNEPHNTSTSNLPKFKISHKNKDLQNKQKSQQQTSISTNIIQSKHNIPSTSNERPISEVKCKTDNILTIPDEVSSSVAVIIPTTNIIASTKSPAKKTTTIVDGQENVGKNIRAEDITAVLSHLHGSEEQ